MKLLIKTILLCFCVTLSYGGRYNSHSKSSSSSHAWSGSGSNIANFAQQQQQQQQQGNGLVEVYNWSQMDFNYLNQRARNEAMQSGRFIPINSSAPAGIEAYGGRVFITLPRWKNGVPATLNTVPFPSNSTSPLLDPYPNWEFNRQGNCEGLTSVYRVKVDECGRLWALDTGTVNSFVKAENICPPQVVAFDLKTDRVIHKYIFNQSVIVSNSQFVTIEVEYPQNSCSRVTDAVLYISDTTSFALIVVNLATGRSWRIRDKTMYPSPEAGTFNVAGETFELMDGILALAFSPKSSRSERLLYFSAMSSFAQHWVPTSILRNETLATESPKAFQTAPQTRSSQSGDSAMDSDGVLFYGLLGEQALACWNTRAPFSPQAGQVLAQIDNMQFPVSVTVDNQSRVWVIGTKFQSFFLGTLPSSGTNFYVYMASSSRELVRGTACQTRPQMNGGPGA